MIDWRPYEDKLTELFPDKFVEKKGSRVYMHMDVIKNDDMELIINKLKEYYITLKKLTS